MARRQLNPNSLQPAPSAEDIRAALVSIWYWVSEAPLSITEDYTTTGSVAIEKIVGANEVPITIKLDDRPADGDSVWIKRTDAQITLNGNGNTIDGETEWVLGTKYDDLLVEYSDLAGEWMTVNKVSFPLNDDGEIRTSDPGTLDEVRELRAELKLLNARFEQAYETGLIQEDLTE